MSITKEFKEVALEKITIQDGHNHRSSFDQSLIDELSESIKDKGILSPLLVRPAQDGQLILVAGERRYRAAKKIKLKKVPVRVKEMTDQEALEIAIIENLQRKDVHPMDEAAAYERLQELHKWNAEEIGQRVGKSASYVAKRMHLLKMIKPLREAFFKGQFGIGHALELCRLSEKDQKSLATGSYDTVFDKTLPELKHYIERNIIRNLSAAPFKKDDPSLNKKAGACTSCPKRSGANKLLFNDIEQEDRCFDKSCFNQKIKVHFIRLIKQMEKEGHEYFFFTTSYSYWMSSDDPLASIVLIKKANEANDILSKGYSSTGYKVLKAPTANSVKGICIEGEYFGQIKDLEIVKKARNNSSYSTKISDLDPEGQIKAYKQKKKRNVEISKEKTHHKIIEAIDADQSPYYALYHSENLQDFNQNHQNLLWYLIYQQADWKALLDWKEVYAKKQLSRSEQGELKAFLEATLEEKVFVMRATLRHQISNGAMAASVGGEILWALARETGIPIDQIYAEQKEIYDKRNERIDQKIAALKEQVTASDKTKKSRRKQLQST